MKVSKLYCCTLTVTGCLLPMCTGLFLHSAELGLSFTAPEIWALEIDHITGLSGLQNYLFWLFVVLGTLIILQVNDKYGPGTFIAFLMGKYFRPKREERIFMFLDLRSSTTIAEQLGEVQYFNFLRDVFQHATPSILYAKGEIYQYVGDEIVISWKMKILLDKLSLPPHSFEPKKIGDMLLRGKQETVVLYTV